MMNHQALAAMLGSYGEFFGAIAVVITLGYLAYQVRQNTRSSYVTRAAAVTSRLEEIQKAIVCDSDLSALLARCRDPELADLTPIEEERVQGIADLYWKLFGSVQTAHSHLEMTNAYFENFRAEFQRIVKTYPALKPRMRSTLKHFDMKLYPIYAPALD
jgi:hypothetical protein